MKTLAISCLAFGALALSQLVIVNCAVCDEIQWGYGYGAFDRYNVNASFTTPAGTPYDPSGLNISPQLIDRLVNEVSTCLDGVAPNGQLPPDIVSASVCHSTTFTWPLERKWFEVKIASDWVYSCDHTQQLLPVLAGNAGCIAKGETPTDTCPCRWRAGIECPNHIITTPSFYLFKDALTRFLTGCENPWANPELAKCASPTTTPLSDGSDPNNGL